jgi:hypothetical protein
MLRARGSGEDHDFLCRPDQEMKVDQAGRAGERRGRRRLVRVARREGGELGLGGPVGQAGQLGGVEAEPVRLDAQRLERVHLEVEALKIPLAVVAGAVVVQPVAARAELVEVGDVDRHSAEAEQERGQEAGIAGPDPAVLGHDDGLPPAVAFQRAGHLPHRAVVHPRIAFRLANEPGHVPHLDPVGAGVEHDGGGHLSSYQ